MSAELAAWVRAATGAPPGVRSRRQPEYIELYHGTASRAAAAAIASTGLLAVRYEPGNELLTTSRSEAAACAGERGAVITVRVPYAEAARYLRLTRGGASLREPLPPPMIARVEQAGRDGAYYPSYDAACEE